MPLPAGTSAPRKGDSLNAAGGTAGFAHDLYARDFGSARRAAQGAVAEPGAAGAGGIAAATRPPVRTGRGSRACHLERACARPLPPRPWWWTRPSAACRRCTARTRLARSLHPRGRPRAFHGGGRSRRRRPRHVSRSWRRTPPAPARNRPPPTPRAAPGSFRGKRTTDCSFRSWMAPLAKANYHIVVAGGTGAWLGDGVPPTSRGGMKLVPRIVRPLFWVALATAATILVAACGGSTPSSTGSVSFKGTKMVGYSAPLTGQSALYGHAVSQSLNLAADDINAKGGVNGYKIQMDIQDDGTTVPQAVSNTKSMILQGHRGRPAASVN